MRIVRGVHSVYGGRILDIYEKAVIAALKNGPKPRYDLVKELCPKTMSKKKLQRTLNELEDEGRIICIPKRTEKTHKWTSCYALPKHRYLLEVELGEVAKALKYLRLELCRNPRVEEVAARIGEDPENVRKLLFKHATELKWKPPTPEGTDQAKESRKKARELAAQIKYSWDTEISLSEISLEDMKRAEFLLEHQLESIKPEHLPSRGTLVGLGIHVGPPPVRERGKKQAIEAIKKLRNLKEVKT